MNIEEAVMKALASVKQEDVLHDYRPFLVIYKDGRVQKFLGQLTVPPSIDSLTGVESKDVVISPESGAFVRMYKPQSIKPAEKVPVLVYFHGGGFVVESAASPVYHMFLNGLASKAKVIVVSVDYRTAPEHPLPAAYDDSWAGLEWVRKAVAGGEPWLKEHADMGRVFLAGDSAGANIAHHMSTRVSQSNPDDKIALKGLVLVHPFFWGKDRIGSELQKMTSTGNDPAGGLADRIWKLAHPASSGADDPLINPAMDPKLGELAGEKVLVFVAEEDALRDRGFHYKEALLKCGWKGDVDVVETKGENHVFHLFNPVSPKAADMMNQFVAFVNSSLLDASSERNKQLIS